MTEMFPPLSRIEPVLHFYLPSQ